MTAPPPASKSPPPASPKPSGPPPAVGGPPPSGQPAVTKDFSLQRGRLRGAQKVLVYGPAGIGKSSLAALAPNPVFLDVEGGTRELDVARFGDIDSFAELRSLMGSDKMDSFDTIVVDTGTKVEELAGMHVIRTIPHEKGLPVTSLLSYGWGKGFDHLFDVWMLFLQDGDRLVRRGKNFIINLHDMTAKVPNPSGDDWIRYEPNLYNPKDSKKNSIRERTIQWADHCLALGYDVNAKDGKGRGGGTRTVFTSERPDRIAKVRGAKERNIPDSMQFKFGEDPIWKLILNTNSGEQK